METTKCLREEHQLIKKVLTCFSMALRESQDSHAVNGELYNQFTEFFRGFADKCHHCKEEDKLFPQMESCGIPREGGPIGVMLMEHEQARQLIKVISDNIEGAAAGNEKNFDSLILNGGKYIALLSGHIDKEDHCLFGMAEQAIQGDNAIKLVQAYTQTASEPDYCDTMTKCKNIAEKLMNQYGVQ